MLLVSACRKLLSLSLEDDDDDLGEDEDEDDGFFVPHGYLSEDEGVTEVRGEGAGLEGTVWAAPRDSQLGTVTAHLAPHRVRGA